jgi:hypothetical protein
MLLIRDLDAGQYPGWSFQRVIGETAPYSIVAAYGAGNAPAKRAYIVESSSQLVLMGEMWAAGKAEGLAEATSTTQDTSPAVEATPASS